MFGFDLQKPKMQFAGDRAAARRPVSGKARYVREVDATGESAACM